MVAVVAYSLRFPEEVQDDYVRVLTKVCDARVAQATKHSARIRETEKRKKLRKTANKPPNP